MSSNSMSTTIAGDPDRLLRVRVFATRGTTVTTLPRSVTALAEVATEACGGVQNEITASIAGSHTVAAERWLADRGGEQDMRANVVMLVEADVLHDGHVAVPKLIHQVAPDEILAA